jgi:Fe-S cluster biosynthesis and repair protein YggX
MSDLIFCQKLKIQAPKMSAPPFPGPLGERIFNEISQQAWSLWLGHQTMLINEYRLNLMDPQARKFLTQEMQKFFFEGGSETPPGFQPK